MLNFKVWNKSSNIMWIKGLNNEVKKSDKKKGPLETALTKTSFQVWSECSLFTATDIQSKN